jgi:hypothetical protein
VTKLFAPFSRDLTRLLLAAMLLVASVAGARLQADAAARWLATGTLGHSVLCSGDVAPGDPESDPDRCRQGHCLSCSFVPQFGALAQDLLPRIVTGAGVAFRAIETSELHRSDVSKTARGPPAIG